MRQTDMLKAPIRSVFFSYLAPSVSATLVTSIYILADTMMIGRGVGASGIAALNLLLPLYSAYYGFGMMCGVGGSVLFGFSRGKGDEEAAKGYFTTALLLAVLLAAASIGLCAAFFDPLLILLGDTPSLNPYSVPYGRVLVAGSPVFVFSSFLQAFVRNDGAPKLAMAAAMRVNNNFFMILCDFRVNDAREAQSVAPSSAYSVGIELNNVRYRPLAYGAE